LYSFKPGRIHCTGVGVAYGPGRSFRGLDNKQVITMVMENFSSPERSAGFMAVHRGAWRGAAK
jgi:hypothetical protein